MRGYIYKITNNINGKAYIGQTINYDRRTARHLAAAKLVFGGDIVYGYIYRAMAKYGIESFKFEILFIVFDSDYLNEYEIFFIAKYNTFGEGGYNCNIGGGSSFGFKHSNESRKKISEAKLISNWQRGRCLTEEHKSKISEKVSGELNPFYGKTHPEHVRKLISEANIGKILTETHREILSECNSGYGNPMYGKLRPEVGTNNKLSKGYKISYNDVEYLSMRDMAAILHVSRNTIAAWIKSGKATKLLKE